MKNNLINLLVGALSYAVPASAETVWSSLYSGVDVARNQSFISAQGEKLQWSGIRIITGNAQLELVDTQQFLERRISSEAGGKIVSGDDSGLISSFGYSLDEIWVEIQADSDVKAVVPIGYIEESGSPQVAGFFKRFGVIRNPLMSAPNLTAVFCLNAEAFRTSNNPERTLTETGVAPYLFDVKAQDSRRYQYLKGLDQLELKEHYADDRIQKYFDSCRDAVQVGPKVVFPRRQELLAGHEPSLAGTRRSVDTDYFRGGRNAYRTYFIWDLRGDITIVTTHTRSSLDVVWELVSNRDFFRSNESCRGLDDLSQACEYWAVALTSFEHSGLIYRDDAGERVSLQRTDSIIPAALIIRVKSVFE